MKGLELARQYYAQYGRAALEQAFPELGCRMAAGLAGEGSECFGFDDEASRDHDWGPAFCIWLDEPDYERYGSAVRAVYNRLPAALAGFAARRDDAQNGRIGCLCTQAWYRRYTGCAEGPRTLAAWRRTPEAFLATAVNGAVFSDPAGKFTGVRQRLLAYYPEDVRIKKMAVRAATMAQAGQYNYPRCVRRGEPVAAQLALAEFTRAALSMAYLLERRYMPFYKWAHRGTRQLPNLSRVGELLAELSCAGAPAQAEELIERLCVLTAAALRRQGLTDRSDTFLLPHCEELMRHIKDPALRQTHIMEE